MINFGNGLGRVLEGNRSRVERQCHLGLLGVGRGRGG